MSAKLGPDRGERGLQVLEHLLGLRPKVAGRELAVAIGAELAGDVDGAAGADDLDHLRIGRRPHQAFGIDEAELGATGSS